VQVLSDTMGVNFDPYFKKIIAIVNTNWHSLLPQTVYPPIRKSGTVSIEFAIMKDGTVTGMKLAGSSGDPPLERASWGSITNSLPFPILPQEFRGQFLQLRFTYCYNDACNPGPKNPALKDPVQDIKRKLAENLANDKTAKTDLENDIATVTKLVDSRVLDSTDDSGARYFRSTTQSRLGTLREEKGLPQDKAAAEQALGDLDRIIASKPDLSAVGITIPNAQYYAGLIAWNQLHSDSRAYSYWKLCADSAHAGCMLNLVSAYTVGWAGLHPDPNKALELSLKVFDSGTTYTCAGARAARSIARLIYFTGATSDKDDDPVSWVQKSYGLSDQIEARPNSKGGCGGAEDRVEEFLYRLARGDRQNDLLSQATIHLNDDSPTVAALINYFSGSIDANAFEATITSAKSDSARCDAFFHALWYADITHNTALAKTYYERLSQFNQFSCGSTLVFAEKFRH
jgi:TonB family protein